MYLSPSDSQREDSCDVIMQFVHAIGTKIIGFNQLFICATNLVKNLNHEKTAL